MASQFLGNALDVLGTFFNAKERGWSERLAGGVPTINTGVTQQSKDAGLDAWRDYHFSQTSSTSTPDLPQTTPRINNPAPAGTPSGFNSKDPNANPGPDYFWDSADGWKLKGGSSSSGVSQEEIDAMFAPAFSSLDRSQAMQTDFYNAERQLMEQQRQQQLTRLGQSQAQTNAKLEDQGNKLHNELESALSQAIRAYNGLSQRGNVLYGGASSTGRAMGELAAKEYYRQSGNMRTQNAEAVKALRQSMAEVEMGYANMGQDIESEFKNSFMQLYKNYVGALNSIDQMRNETEMSKRQLKFEIKDRVSQMEQQLHMQREQNKMALEQWYQQQQYLQNQEMNAIASSTWTKPEQVFDDTTNLNVKTPGQKMTSALYKKNQNDEDEWTSLMNFA